MSTAPNSPTHDRIELQLGSVGKRGAREDSFFDGRFLVRSRDGVPGEEKSLLNILPSGKTGEVLILGTPTIATAVAWKLQNPAMVVTLYHEDHWDHARALEDLAQVPEDLRPHCCLSADPPAGPYDAVAVAFPRVGLADLLRDTVRASSNNWLKKGALLYGGYAGESDSFLRKELQKAFGSVTITKTARRHSFGYVARRPDTPLVNRPDSWSSYTVKEGDEILSIRARPGVFCHDRLDNGTRALLALADLPEGGRICDLGCGAGVVAVVAGRRSPRAHLTCIDASARALDATRINLEQHGLLERSELLLNSDPISALSALEKQDVIITNPPYYGNWRIAQSFVQAAVASLRSGGRLILVTKGPNWFRENLPEELVPMVTGLRGGYSVMEFRRR